MEIKNFCIIAHIDHGKSTLADRLLEYTGTISKREMKEQILDGMELERERGITIKAKAIRMKYTDSTGKKYILNLIDTPGHVDFTYEVSRALAACEGALLVVDAAQGVQAQTLANTFLARQANLKIIPIINKIDLPTADVENTYIEMEEGLDISDEPILVSAKEGKGIDEVIKSIIENVPSPKGDAKNPVSVLIFDSFYDSFRGVIIIIRVLEGEIRPGMKIKFLSSGAQHEIIELGYMKIKMVATNSLSAGDVGYIVAGIKDIHDVKIGDTITEASRPTNSPHPGYKEVKPFVFAGLYPMSASDYNDLKTAI
ncbi:GTP-binding protein, partial [Elusimicrobiota bacterium]